MEALANLHPLVIHFPIVLLMTYALLEIVGIFSKDSSISGFAYIILIVAVLSSVAALVTGNQAAHISESLYSGNFNIPKQVIEQHQLFATITVWFYVLVFLFRTYLVVKKKFIGRMRYIFIIFAIVGVYFIVVTGNLGGKLVFNHGVGTELTSPQ